MDNQKNLSPISYLALGDSITEGIGATSPQSHWAAQYFEDLKHSPNCNLRNFGISGMTSVELLQLVSTPAVSRLISRATHISVTTGGCDFIELYKQYGFHPGKFYDSMAELKMRTDEILIQIRKSNPLANLYVLGFYIPIPAYAYGVDLASIMIKTMNDYYQEICIQSSAIMVNPFDAFLERHDYFADEVHPNQQGYDVLAELFRKLDK